jgi:hypothetical protein
MTARWIKNASAAVLVCAAFFPTLAVAQQQEPATPTLQETADYILSHIQGGGTGRISWNGSIVTIVTPKMTVTYDDKDIWQALPGTDRSDNLYVLCTPSQSGNPFLCQHYSSPDGATRDWDRYELICENVSIRPNVVNAMNHFINLLRQQNMPANDPFAPK